MLLQEIIQSILSDINEAFSFEEYISPEKIEAGKLGQRKLTDEFKRNFSKSATNNYINREIAEMLIKDPTLDKLVTDRFINLRKRIENHIKNNQTANFYQLSRDIYQGKDVPFETKIKFIRLIINGEEKRMSGGHGGILHHRGIYKYIKMMNPSFVKFLKYKNDITPEQQFIYYKLHKLGFDHPENIIKEWGEYREDIYDQDPAIAYFIDTHYRYIEPKWVSNPSTGQWEKDMEKPKWISFNTET